MNSLTSSLLNSYLFFSILTCLLTFNSVSSEYLLIYIYLSFYTLVFYFTLLYVVKFDIEISSFRLFWIVFLYGIIFVSLNNIVSYSYTGNYFVFSETDAETYDYFAKSFNERSSFGDGVEYFLQYYGYDDLGAVVYIAYLYRIFESNLFVNFFYICIGSFTGVAIFKVAKYHMSPKLGFVCALVYSISSYVLWFHSSGLKESVLVYLVTQSFVLFYQYRHSKSFFKLSFFITLLFIISFFRPPISFLIAASVGISSIVSVKSIAYKILLSVIVVVSTIALSSEIILIQERFIVGENFGEMIDLKESSGMIQGGVGISYAANVIAALIGPLPTFNPSVKTLLAFYAPGLYFRTIFAFCFFAGIFFILKKKETSLFPIVAFLFFSMFSLVFILEALELRKSLPHFPLIYIISFWFIDKFDYRKLEVNTNYRRLRLFNRMSILAGFLLIIYWNFRF